MSGNDFVMMAQQHVIKHQGLLSVVARLIANTAIMAASMLMADWAFKGFYPAPVALFMLLSGCTELLWGRLSMDRVRYYCYVGCVFGILVAGLFLLHGSCALARTQVGCCQSYHK